MHHATILGKAVGTAIAVGWAVAFVIMYVAPAEGRASLVLASQFFNVLSTALLVSLPISVLAGIVGGVVVIRNRSSLAKRSCTDRAAWGFGRGTIVGSLVTVAYFVALGGLNWAVPMLAILGGLTGGGAGAVIASCCFGPQVDSKAA